MAHQASSYTSEYFLKGRSSSAPWTAVMAECSSLGNEDLYTSMVKLHKLDAIKRNSRSIKGSFTRYILNPNTLIDEKRLRRETFGEKDKSKPHKTILMVGETGTGKSTLINAFINYMLGIKWENRIWCEITETKENLDLESQTQAVTVYKVFVEESSFSLTVIDTPGYGSTEGIENDLQVTETLHELFRSADGVQEVDAVCLVVSSNTSRLTERHLYVFDAILSLFGFDVEKNIVLLITRSNAQIEPKCVLKAIKKSNVKCAKTPDGKPVYFSFDNSHCENFQDEDENVTENKEDYHKYKDIWVNNEKTMNRFFVFLNKINPISLQMTESVLRTRKQLTASITNLKDRITFTEYRKEELEETMKALKEFEKEKKDQNNFEYEVDQCYKEKVPIEFEWWHLNKEATCCSVCEENCHYPGCWWVRDLSWCSVMSKGKCTVCTGRCDYTQHVKEGKIYKIKTQRVKKTYKETKKEYEEKYGKTMSLMCCLENEIKKHETEKTRLVEECYQYVITLDKIALKSTAVSTLQHLDFLIEKVKETGKMERVQKLEELKTRSEAENPGISKRALQYFFII